MNGCRQVRAFAEYFEREISAKKLDGREPSILPPVSYIFFPPPYFPRSVFRFFLLFGHLVASFLPHHSFIFLFPFLFSRRIPSLAFVSSCPPLSRIPPSRRKIGEHTQASCQSYPPPSHVCCSGHFSLSLFCPCSATLSPFPLGLTAAHASDHPGCKKRRVVRTEKRLIFIRSLSFSTLDILCNLFSLSPSFFFFFCSITRSFERNELETRGHVNRVESRLIVNYRCTRVDQKD